MTAVAVVGLAQLLLACSTNVAKGDAEGPTAISGPTSPGARSLLGPTSTVKDPTPMSATTSEAPPTTTAPSGRHFSTLPPGSPLPSDDTCAAEVRPVRESRPRNAVFNAVRGVRKPPDGAFPTFGRVDGNYTGTTDEILQWAACKWGIDEDVVRAQAAVESWWNQTNLGDWATDKAVCAPGHPIGANSDHPQQCPESIGILQVRYHYWSNGFPQVETSTAYNADYVYAAWRACYEGDDGWLNTVDHTGMYGPGDLWGCVGLWFAGRWHTPPAEGYVAKVQSDLHARVWAQGDFR